MPHSVEFVKVESRSLLNISKRMDPKTEPCGIPLETAFHEDGVIGESEVLLCPHHYLEQTITTH